MWVACMGASNVIIVLDIMKMKRMANSSRKGAIKADAFISRHAGGIAFDFSHFDPNM